MVITILKTTQSNKNCQECREEETLINAVGTVKTATVENNFTGPQKVTVTM